MKQVERTFPLPYFIINKNYFVQSYSKEAEQAFGRQENLLELLDEASVPKVKNWVTPEVQKLSLEVHLKPEDGQGNPQTCDMHVKWENDMYAEVLILTKDEQLSKVTKTLDQLRSRLNDTNFELLEEKEKLEDAIENSNQLSAPFIRLTADTALVPLFGDITAEKMYSVETSILKAAQKSDIDRVLFDFTAVGEMELEGAGLLKNIMISLLYMGAEVMIIGMQPVQAQSFQMQHFPSSIKYMNSLQQAVQKYCVK
ncbi:STAS domain-containing protein [Halobacillus sp. ACCC02827]|uniref:STAS domain-containing protein n=1 Tax=Bacillaceae TaxID=186817 RepID=UPI0002A4E395|nr:MULTISPECIES: STAS domain-containing protein [Bacillaceae]ELK47007.1 hypothetical protein D479_08571 [Halobacillus sp. BAB-2008]QHT47557.1 STAS domain-containing protein [Bacillus sp. SB49]WJE14787.1 STAS domain-containing protein [Halobacillus sp. ACCC02827]